MIKSRTKTLIVGAGVAGRELLHEIKKYSPIHYHVVGFIDDKKKGKIKEVPILGSIEDLGQIIEKFGIDVILIAIPSAKGETILRIIDGCKNQKISFKIVPRSLEIVKGRVSLDQIRNLQIEDLLGREINKSEQPFYEKAFKGKTVLVTGAAGSIGSELCRQIIQFNPKKLICFDWWENGIFDLEAELLSINPKNNLQGVIGSVQDFHKVNEVFKQNKPEIVFHAAAFKHVHLMQRYPDEAIKNNIFGTENVAKAAIENNVDKFVFISTDKAADPFNIMGATKLVGEKIVTFYNSLGKTNFSAVRFGNVVGSNGSVVPLFNKQILKGGPVTVTDKEMTRFVMTIPEAVQLVLYASVIGKGGELFILDMGEPIKIDDFARLMIKIAGFIPDQEIKINYVGRRPGEKLSEVLVSTNEILEKTSHPRINKVKLDKSGNVKKLLQSFKKQINRDGKRELLKILKTIAPNLEEVI